MDSLHGLNLYPDVDDFCLWAPPEPNGEIGETEREEVAWCTKSGYGTRVIPDGTLTGVHFVQTKDYVQVTGVGDFTKINVKKGDYGGGKYLVLTNCRIIETSFYFLHAELDPHGAGAYSYMIPLSPFNRDISRW